MKRFILVLVIMMGITACNNTRPANPPAKALMPEIAGYQSAKTQKVEEFIANAAGGAAALSGNLEIAAAIKAVDSISQCYQNKGAVEVRAYSSKQDPLSAGAIVIADKQMLSDPTLLFQCARGKGELNAASIEPCNYSYTLKRTDNEFYIAYVGSTSQICNDFCTNLEGCQNSQQ